MSAYTELTVLDSQKEDAENCKIDELHKISNDSWMIQALTETFRRSTDKRIEGKSNDVFRYDLNINEYTEIAK